MGPLGFPETVFIFVLALLLFGPKKLPELGKTVGKALTEFRRASNELKSTFNREMANLEQETAELKAEANKIQGEISSSVHDGSYNYDYNYYDSGNDGYQPYESAGSSVSTDGASATEGADPLTAGSSADVANEKNSGLEGTVPVETATVPKEPKSEISEAESTRQTA